jgi:hypothetical protein
MRLVEEENLCSGNSEAATGKGGWKAILEKNSCCRGNREERRQEAEREERNV